MKNTSYELILKTSKTEKRTFRLIETLPEDFLTEADFDFSEEVLLELDF